MTSLLLAAAVHAAVSQVTVYGDRARVERVADVQVEGTARVELPLLPDSIDSSSIRVSATGGPEVQRIDVQHVEPDEFPVDAARKLIVSLEQVDDRIKAADGEREALGRQLASLARIKPEVAKDPLKPPPKLNPAGWGAAMRFTEGEMAPLRTRLHELEQKLIDLHQEREKLAEQGRILGGAERRSGWRVVAVLSGSGAARLTMTYVARNARWVPEYALQLGTDQKSVRVWFGGTASQETGEDWADSALTLSTAVPATARALPEIATWKIGEKERFIPTPVRGNQPAAPEPLPAVPPVDQRESEADRVRAMLEERVDYVEGVTEVAAYKPKISVTQTTTGGTVSKEQMKLVPYGRTARNFEAVGTSIPGVDAKVPPPPSPAPQRDAKRAPGRREAQDIAGISVDSVTAMSASAPRAVEITESLGEPVQGGLSPPATWQPQPLPPDAPNALAGGYDLEFPSNHRETLKSGDGARKVSLFSESWPVTTERLLFPALSQDAYLVAQLKNPSQRTLPRGRAQLMVGNDPAGNAELPLVSPGEEITLPLGIDRAIKPFRNVAQVQSEKGLFSKDDVTRYEVTIEVANPYPAPVALRVVDQLPRAGNEDMHVEDTDAKGAEFDEGTGKLTWKVTAPARGKSTIKFAYSLRRPKGYKVHQ